MNVHTSRFRVQIFDVDAWGEMRTSVALRFLQQAASDASAAVGFDVEWYARAGALWVIRRTTIEFLEPAHYRDELAVRTWVSDLRRVRSQREYEMRRVGSETLLARAVTDWVYLDLTRGALAQPPEEMRRRLMPDAVSRPRPARAAAAPSAAAVQVARRVELADLDSVGHVNNAQYAVYVEQAVHDALAARGGRPDTSPSAPHLRVRRHDLEYFAEAQYGDALAATVWVAGVTPHAFASECALVRDATRVLHASSEWMWSEADMPSALRTAARDLAAAADD
jgi:acyl-CoA thioester hydrolase